MNLKIHRTISFKKKKKKGLFGIWTETALNPQANLEENSGLQIPSLLNLGQGRPPPPPALLPGWPRPPRPLLGSSLFPLIAAADQLEPHFPQRGTLFKPPLVFTELFVSLG